VRSQPFSKPFPSSNLGKYKYVSPKHSYFLNQLCYSVIRLIEWSDG
jgi:hypothetical protein